MSAVDGGAAGGLREVSKRIFSRQNKTGLQVRMMH